MGEADALKVAIEILHVPSRVRHARSRPLPDGVLILLQVASGDDEAAARAAELTGRSVELVTCAAVFFVEQILFSQHSDSYRVLGATSEATNGELRRNMALLLKWLHPDIQRGGERSVFAPRVALAWDNLKTPDRRAAYDNAQGAAFARNSWLRRSRWKKGRSIRRRGARCAEGGVLGRIISVLFGRDRR